MFHELYSISSLLCIARNVRFEIPYKVLYFETPCLMIFKYYAWASYAVFKSYFTATRVACATRVKRLTRFLARHWLEAGRKLLHVRMS